LSGRAGPFPTERGRFGPDQLVPFFSFSPKKARGFPIKRQEKRIHPNKRNSSIFKASKKKNSHTPRLGPGLVGTHLLVKINGRVNLSKME
jgi:hypothetical protein